MDIKQILSRVLPSYAVSIDSPFFRYGDATFQPGTLHGGTDFNYVNNSENVKGVASVYTPVSGVVVDINTEWGWVVIRSDADGTFHRILHMHSINLNLVAGVTHVNAGGSGNTGDLLGTIGGRGKGKLKGSASQYFRMNHATTPTH